MESIHYAPLTNLDISRVLKNDKETKKIFNGVYAADTLPKQASKNSAFIVNTDTKDKPGAHWVAIYFDSFGNAEYFDSYAMPPIVGTHEEFIKKNSKNCVYNSKTLQSLTSSVCGHYCVLYVGAKARNITLKKFVHCFNAFDVYSNDAFAILAFRLFFDVVKGRESTKKEDLICRARCACAKW